MQRHDRAARHGCMFLTLRHPLRLMRRSPGITAVALLSIAIGTGATAVVFAAVKAVLIEPFPYAKASELVQIRTDDVRADPHGDWIYMQDATRETTSFSSWGIYRYAVFNLAADSGALPESLYGLTISATLFPALGVTPMLGRNILPEEDQPKGACVIELSYGLWARRFNSDRVIVGRSVQMNGHACKVVGVMPPEFNFPMRLVTTVRTPSPYMEFWAAPGVRPDPDLLRNREDFGYGAVARLRPGVTAAQASQELESISTELAREYPASNKDRSMRALPLVERNLGISRSGLWLALGAAALFMLIGCVNVANLLLARGLARQREFAIRFAVGADRAAIVRQLIGESMILATLGGLAGFLLTAFAWRVLPGFAPMRIPRLASARADVWVLAFTIVVSLVNGMVFGVLPAFRASQSDPHQRLRDSGSRGGLRAVLVSAEAALAVILVVTGSLLASTLIGLLRVDTGFDSAHVLASIIVPAGDRYPTPESRAALWPRVLDAVNRVPGVEAAGTVDALPFSGENNGPWVTGDPAAASRGEGRTAETDLVSAGYLQTMGVKLIAGRWFRDDDVTAHRTVAIVDEIAARSLWPGRDAVGQRICVYCGPNRAQTWYDVVGVVSSMRHASLDENPGPSVYLTSRAFENADFLVVRASHPTARMAQEIRQAVASADPNQPVLLSATLSTLVGDSIADRRFVFSALAIMGFLALLLAAGGVYGVVSHATSKRTREIGIRMAIGAAPHDVVALIFGQGMRPVIIGVAAGIAGALASVRVLRAAFSGLAPSNSAVFMLAIGSVLASACAACLIPAFRASRLDPLVGLRQE